MKPGAVIAGFRVGRELGRGSRGVVYEALQLSLERPVALRLLEPGDFADFEDEARFLSQQRIAASLHHPGVVPTYEAGEWEGGRFVATRFIRGRTLAAVIDAGGLSSDRARSVGEQVAAAIAAAHAAGLAHGRISPDNVLVDPSGAALVSDLGLGRPGTVEEDLVELAALTGVLERASGARRRRRLLATLGAGLAVIAAGVALLVTTGSADEDPSAEPPPAVVAGSDPLGSELGPGPADAIGCADELDPNTPVCTLSQTSIAGRSTRVQEDGVIRSWAVRNTTGDLSLQVVGFRHGKAFLRSFSQVESASDGGPHAFATGIRVERGDLVAVTLAPGASIGARDGGSGTAALRWDGTLPYEPLALEPARLSQELLLRIDVDAGARPVLRQLTGRAAEAAPEGAGLAAQVVQAPGGRAFRVEVTRVGSSLTVDSFSGGRRVARAGLDGTEVDGRLLSFEGACGFEHGFCFRWQNEGDADAVIHAYRLTPEGAFTQIG